MISYRLTQKVNFTNEEFIGSYQDLVNDLPCWINKREVLEILFKRKLNNIEQKIIDKESLVVVIEDSIKFSTADMSCDDYRLIYVMLDFDYIFNISEKLSQLLELK